MLMVFKTFVKPATTFAETVAPPAPDYFNLEHWAALPGREDALELAYTDIEAAFEHYLAEYNNGRPFIIAGHSQGAQHIRL